MDARRHAAIVVMMIGLTGCATVDPAPRWQQLQQISAEATPQELIWERDAADAERIRAAVDAMLADKLTRDEAIRIALINNRDLQVSFEDIGIAQANFVQACLFTNPKLEAFIAFPISLANNAVTLVGLLSDLWTVSARKQVAAARTRAAVRRVAAEVVRTAAEAELAYDEVLYREASVALEQRIYEVQTDTVARVQERVAEGKVSELELHHTQTVQFDAEISVARARRDAALAHARLDRVLGLSPRHPEYELSDQLALKEDQTWTVEDAVAFALEHRSDVAIARLRVEQARRTVELERREVFRSVEVGPGYAGAFGSADSGGPILKMEVPLFDQNQAQIAKAELQVRQAEKELQAEELRTSQEIVEALAEIDFRREQIHILRDHVQPMSARISQAMQASRERANLNLMDILAMRAFQIAERRSFVNALWKLREAQVELHRVLWGGAK